MSDEVGGEEAEGPKATPHHATPRITPPRHATPHRDPLSQSSGEPNSNPKLTGGIHYPNANREAVAAGPGRPGASIASPASPRSPFIYLHPSILHSLAPSLSLSLAPPPLLLRGWRGSGRAREERERQAAARNRYARFLFIFTRVSLKKDGHDAS